MCCAGTRGKTSLNQGGTGEKKTHQDLEAMALNQCHPPLMSYTGLAKVCFSGLIFYSANENSKANLAYSTFA